VDPTGSLTLHHWQQLAKPHLGTILDPHPGVVTKGFRPLAQDAVYCLSDMEEDEERGGVLEKGAAERGKEEEEEEEEEEEGGGITFKVRFTSTPEERRERKHLAPPLPPTLPASPGTPAACPSVTEKPPRAGPTVVQSQSPILLVSTSSPGKRRVFKIQGFIVFIVDRERVGRSLICCAFSPKSREVPELHLLHLHHHDV